MNLDHLHCTALIKDPAQNKIISAWLSSHNLSCLILADENEFMQTVSELQTHDIIFVSWVSGHANESADLIRQITNSLNKNPFVVALSSSDQENDIVCALIAGADRFIHMGLSPRIVQAILEALLRPTGLKNNSLWFQPYEINTMTREIRIEDRKIILTPGEFRIAKYLFENEGRILSREVMLRDIWGLPNLANNRRVDTKISHLRKKMSLDGTYGWVLQYPAGKGYQLLRIKPTVNSGVCTVESEEPVRSHLGPDFSRLRGAQGST